VVFGIVKSCILLRNRQNFGKFLLPSSVFNPKKKGEVFLFENFVSRNTNSEPIRSHSHLEDSNLIQVTPENRGFACFYFFQYLRHIHTFSVRRVNVHEVYKISHFKAVLKCCILFWKFAELGCLLSKRSVKFS